jgi:high-affinity nickel-transport protein
VLTVAVLLNVGAWIDMTVATARHGALLETGVLAYLLGLKHAFDADHIAAIDNVTRKLRADGLRAGDVGLFFSLGHSTIVMALSLAVALFVVHAPWMNSLAGDGVAWGLGISAGFLTLIGAVNLRILARLFRGDGTTRAVQGSPEDGGPKGPLSVLFGPVYRRIRRGYEMYFVGLLFGLGFDTASEVAVLGIAATAQYQGLPMRDVMVFPLLFTAGMSLLDSLDGVVMAAVYDWAYRDAARKRRFNLVITGIGVGAAFGIGAVEWVGVFAHERGHDVSGVLAGPSFSVAGGVLVFLMGLVTVIAVLSYRRALRAPAL